ncbi:MAG: hypothetical protein V3U20_05490, partial [Thermoplasmata archaeon]
MSKKIAYFLAFCVVSMGLMLAVPSASADQIATFINTHHREGTFGSYSYPPDIYFREEYDLSTIPDGYDNVYFSFLATEDGNPFVGNLWLFIYDPSYSLVTKIGFDNPHMITLNPTNNGWYQSWNEPYYLEIDDSDPTGEYTLEISNGTSTIGTHNFWVYDPSVWTATINLYEDSAHTIPTVTYPTRSNVYFTVHIEDENGGPLYNYLEYEDPYSYVEHDGRIEEINNIWLDYEGDGDDWFD